MSNVSFDPARTAVLSMDFHASIVSVYVKDECLIERAADVLNRARSAGMTIIHVQVGFRPNLPEISPRNLLFGAIKNSPQWQKMFESDAAKLHPSVAPAGDDIVITKHRVGAFPGTDLEMILRSKEIDTLVLFGIATSGVVLSTLRYASDADYRLVVLRDCCTDQDAEVHACLVDKVFSRQAAVVTANEFLEGLKSGS
jgi:nicotinamidase-related amidase